jgi:hypothetical protein
MQINPKTGLPYKSTLAEREAAKGYRIKGKQTVNGRAVVLINNARTRSVKKNINMEVTQAWVEEHLTRGTCEITGMPFNLAPPPSGVTRRWDAPSLDRISKHKHYTEDNTRVILWAVNCALAEYGTETMLPVLKAMVKGIEDAQQKSASPVPTGHHREGKDVSKHGALLTARIGENSDDAHHHCGADARQDVDSSPQASSGNSVGHRDNKVGTPLAFEGVQNYGYSSTKIKWDAD